MNRLSVILATVVAATSLGTAPAEAAASTHACWNEFDTYKVGSTIYATAYKDCTDSDVPVALTLTLQTQACDGGGCVWASWKQGTGTVTYTCAPGEFGWFRNSRLPSKIVKCL